MQLVFDMHFIMNFHGFSKDFGRIYKSQNEGFWLHPRKCAFGRKTTKTCKKLWFLQCFGKHMFQNPEQKFPVAKQQNRRKSLNNQGLKSMPSKIREIQFSKPFWLPKTIVFSRFWQSKSISKTMGQHTHRHITST